MVFYPASFINRKLCGTEPFSAILTNLPMQKLEKVKHLKLLKQKTVTSLVIVTNFPKKGISGRKQNKCIYDAEIFRLLKYQ